MRRANKLIPKVLDIENLQLAFWKASKGKRHTVSVLAYQESLDQNLICLQKQIDNAKVKVGDYRYFLIYEPKEREICASAFSEQVLHHALMNVCHSRFEKAQVFDSYASRKGKGTYAALDRAKSYTKKYEWFLKLDVEKFFASIHHDVLKAQLCKMFKEPQLLSIFYQIIDSYEASPNRGLPIGNLTSQYFANHHLSGLDHFIKEQLHIKAYVRYMDDMILWSGDKVELKEAKNIIEAYVENKLHLKLKPFQLNRTKLGLPFLGYRVFPYHLRLLQKSKVRFIRKLKRAYEFQSEGIWNESDTQAHVLPLIAFTEKATSIPFRKKVLLNIEGQSS